MSNSLEQFQDMLRQLEAICDYPESAIKIAKAYMDGMKAGSQMEAAKGGRSDDGRGGTE